MSQATGAPNPWIRDDRPGPAREHLRSAVAALTRARRLQVLIDHGCGGLVAGLGAATVTVLLARLMPSPYPAWQLASAVVLTALTVALVLGWRRRPASLEVAIRADLTLKLKQRLSTAWEFTTVDGNDELADRLAMQAVKAGLPARPWAVFPLRVNRWGWLAPLAAAALLLASVVDLDRVQTPVRQAVDEQVTAEGQRLGEFGRAMQERAERDKLPRSATQAAQIERLGARMESGALSRGQAMGQLRQMGKFLDAERMQALAEASQAGGGSRRAQSAAGSSMGPDLNPGAMLERLQRGALDSDDTRALARRGDELERSGIPRRELDNALERHRSGADDALRDILEKLTRLDRALKEDRELSNAQEQVRRAQENLGDARAGSNAERGRIAGMEWGDDDDDDRSTAGAANTAVDAHPDGATAGKSTLGASQGGSGIADRQHSPLPADPGPSGQVLAPQGQLRDGPSFTSHGQVLPRSGRPSVQSAELSAEFAAQVEAVVSREQYPAHYKEFIRRYFLNLSQDAKVRQEQPPAREKRNE
jgi:hypothetical protein